MNTTPTPWFSKPSSHNGNTPSLLSPLLPPRGGIRGGLLLAALLLAALLLIACNPSPQEGKEGNASLDSIPHMVMQIKKCSKLYTAEYNVHKIVTHDDQIRLRGTILSKEFDIPLPMGNRKIAIPLDAKLKAYIDFADFSEKNVKRRGQKIEIILPDPQVELTSSRINHEEIKKQVPLLRANFTDEEITNYERQGRAAIIAAVPQMGIIPTAQEAAAHTLIPLIRQMGFQEQDITISFRKEFTLDDMPTLMSSYQN